MLLRFLFASLCMASILVCQSQLSLPSAKHAIKSDGFKESPDTIIVSLMAPLPKDPARLAKMSAKKRKNAGCILINKKRASLSELRAVLKDKGYANPKWRDRSGPRMSISRLLIRADHSHPLATVKAILELCSDTEIRIFRIAFDLKTKGDVFPHYLPLDLVDGKFSEEGEYLEVKAGLKPNSKKREFEFTVDKKKVRAKGKETPLSALGQKLSKMREERSPSTSCITFNTSPGFTVGEYIAILDIAIEKGKAWQMVLESLGDRGPIAFRTKPVSKVEIASWEKLIAGELRPGKAKPTKKPQSRPTKKQ